MLSNGIENEGTNEFVYTGKEDTSSGQQRACELVFCTPAAVCTVQWVPGDPLVPIPQMGETEF